MWESGWLRSTDAPAYTRGSGPVRINVRLRLGERLRAGHAGCQVMRDTPGARGDERLLTGPNVSETPRDGGALAPA